MYKHILQTVYDIFKHNFIKKKKKYSQSLAYFPGKLKACNILQQQSNFTRIKASVIIELTLEEEKENLQKRLQRKTYKHVVKSNAPIHTF